MTNKTNNGGSPWRAVHRVRIGHVRKFLQHCKYGAVLPNSEEAYQDLRVLLHCVAQACKPENRARQLIHCAETMAPWMPSTRARDVAADIAAKPLKVTSRWLGKTLGVTADVRDQLAIWQLAACDLTPEEAVERARERRRQQDRDRKRLQRERQPRAEWLAEHCTSRSKPWEALGISRATYYRRRKADQLPPCRSIVLARHETSLSATVSERALWPAGTCEDTPVSRSQGCGQTNDLEEVANGAHRGLADTQRRARGHAGQGEQAEQDSRCVAPEAVYAQGGHGPGLQAAAYR